MSKYRFSIKDYHAIGEADILIDGITVLAGPNGSGKSTLSRWLYYLIDIATKFDSYVVQGFYEELNSKLLMLNRAVREMAGLRRERQAFSENMELYTAIGSLRTELQQATSIEKNVEKTKQVIRSFVVLLDKFLLSDISVLRKDRVKSYLNGLLENGDGDLTPATFEEQFELYLDRNVKHLRIRQSTRSMRDVHHFLADYLNEDDAAPQDMQLLEDDVNIVEHKYIGTLFNIDNAIYVDMPMVLDNNTLMDNIFLERLHESMLQKVEGAQKENKMLLLRISKLLNGRIKVKEENLFGRKELLYERKADGLILPLEKIATGMKTFAYLFQLLNNGYLDDKTILMIDEPEAHLHPQWIVEFARILVLIHKTLGTKMLLASHDPDFIAAIKAIAKREGVIDETNFYLSKACESHSFRYDFRWLDKNIEPIFESFNIALDRIQQYGDTDI